MNGASMLVVIYVDGNYLFFGVTDFFMKTSVPIKCLFLYLFKTKVINNIVQFIFGNKINCLQIQFNLLLVL